MATEIAKMVAGAKLKQVTGDIGGIAYYIVTDAVTVYLKVTYFHR